MSATKIVAIVCVYALACGGWYALGFTTARRAEDRKENLTEDVESLWGRELLQEAPSFFAVSDDATSNDRDILSPTPGTGRFLPTKSDVAVDLAAEPRRKGLVWYPTYRCSFDGTYVLALPASSALAQAGVAGASTSDSEGRGIAIRCRFVLPAPRGTYDDFLVTVDGKALEMPTELDGALEVLIRPAAGEERELRVAYKTRGIRQWRYDPTGGVGRVRNLTARVTTDFRAVDYPDGCLSPMQAEPQGGGMKLSWTASDLITRAALGVIVPQKLNPGPLISRITFFAPVCLVFFFILVGTISILYEVGVHPMHYLFVAAGFFAFHLLLAYLADHVTIHAAFPISAATSVILVTMYLSAALRGRFPWRVALGGQVFFLVLFSYSFFLEGMTGLVVALGSVVTLAFLMRVTAHVDWDTVFRREGEGVGQSHQRPAATAG